MALKEKQRSPLESALEALPRSYLAGTNLLDETRSAIHRLNALAAVAREFEPGTEDFVTDRGLEALNVLSAERRPDRRRFVALDCKELSDAFVSLHDALGPFPEIREADLSISAAIPIISVIDAVIPVLRGHLESVNVVPLVTGENVLALMTLLVILGDDGQLGREDHGWGYHYHYCNSRGERSDTVLTFDLGQPDVPKRPREDNCPLFWERHHESGADFKARADRWQTNKRSRVFTAAKPELSARQFQNFRRPTNKAQPVWWEDAKLSDRPARN